MVYLAIGALTIGVLCSKVILSTTIGAMINLSTISEYLLYILMFSVGISLGVSEGIVDKIKTYNIKVIFIPVGVIIGSILGGIICSFILDMNFRHSLAIASAMGWYSLSGVMLETLANTQIGVIAFLSNLLREFIAFISIPILIKFFNPYTAIAAAGATSEDTTLPVLIKYGGAEYIIISVISGVLCSVAVPILINFYFAI